MTNASLIAQRLQDEEERTELVRSARARVDQARELHARLTRELAALQVNPRKNQTAIERFRLELERARTALRERQRELIRCMA